jgi:uncharacterized membrane protein
MLNKVAIHILLLGAIMFVLDAVYLHINHKMILPVYQSIQGSPITIRYSSAIVCYLIMTFGLYYFIIREHKTTLEAFLLGLFVYGVYDTTTFAIFQKYTLEFTVMDMLWGGILFASTTFLYYYITHKRFD